jgi:Fic family protein
MVSIVTKRINGKEYLYLVASVRHGDKVTQKTVGYIGRKRPVPKDEFRCMEISYKEEDWVLHGFNDELSYQDHQRMRAASKQHKAYLASLDQVSREKQRERFLSEFIANSNAIEGSTMTANDTFNYLFNDLAPDGKSRKELFMASNLLDAWNYVEKNHSRLPSKDDLCELHRRVNKGVESDATLGSYKKVQNYVGDMYTTSHLFTEERMARLFKWIKTAYKEIDDFEVAFQSHAQFELIHPFVDGNGRVGRLLINWLLMNRSLMYFAIRSKRRSDYLSALKNAQKGKMEAICGFCLEEYLAQNKFM